MGAARMLSLGPRGVQVAEASPISTTRRKSFSLGDMSPSAYDLTPSAYDAMDDSPRFRAGTEWTNMSAFGDQTPPPRFRLGTERASAPTFENLTPRLRRGWRPDELTIVSAFGDQTPLAANSTDSMSAFKWAFPSTMPNRTELANFMPASSANQVPMAATGTESMSMSAFRSVVDTERTESVPSFTSS